MKKKIKKIIFLIVLLLFCCLSFSLGLFSYKKLFIPKVAVLYIATNRYIVFWDEFYESMEKNFLPELEKHYFIFTNHTEMKFPDNVTVVYREGKGFPDDTLDRYDMFLSIQDQLKKYDYTYFLNANAFVLNHVGTEIFPSPEQGITVAWHPGYYREKKRETFPYDTNPRSTAYIPKNQGKYYVQGGFNGGITEDFLKMSQVLSNDIKENKRRKIIARWHDESHLNHYIIDKKPLILQPTYIWANFDYTLLNMVYQNDIRIEMRYKDKYGGVDYLRGHTDEKLESK